jgi:hypothetical protein
MDYNVFLFVFYAPLRNFHENVLFVFYGTLGKILVFKNGNVDKNVKRNG